MRLLVATQTLAGFTLVGRLATLRHKVTRPKRVQCLRLMSLLFEAPNAELLRRPLDQLVDERAILNVSSFQLTRTVKFILAHLPTLHIALSIG